MSEPKCECGHGASYHASGECWTELIYEGPLCRCTGWKRAESADRPAEEAAESVSDFDLDAIEARADYGCDGHGRHGADLLYCPCVEQTAVDVRQLLAEVRRLRAARQPEDAREMPQGD